MQEWIYDPLKKISFGPESATSGYSPISFTFFAYYNKVTVKTLFNRTYLNIIPLSTG